MKLLLIYDFSENKDHMRAQVNSGILLVGVFIKFNFIVFKKQTPFTRPIVKTWKLAVLSVVSCSCAVHSSAQMLPVSCSHGSDVTNQLYFHWSRLSTNSLKQNLLQVAVVAW